jgi:putative peptide zinc metalloprotease protein
MTAPLTSNLWYRVAGRRPQLRSHARIFRHRYRGEVWYLVQDPASSRLLRFTPAARLIISLMDGTRTVAQLCDVANRRLGEHAPTQDEVIHLLGQLHAADLLQSDVTPDVAELIARGEREDRARYRRSFANPMALRIPLWDPDRFLNLFEPVVRIVWSRWGALIWLATALPALFLVPPHWPELTNDFTDRVLAVDNLVAIYFAFPLIKALHELGHATAIKAGGGEVHDMGVILLVLLPVPYVEASASTVFRSKYQRALVGAAGVAVELFVAALAFYAWLIIEPGLVRAVLFNVMVIASVSTVIFNGNPLLRYDAYYILADLIEIPNLAGRSARYWGYLLERYALGVRDVEPPDASGGEKAWFVCYGFLATAYRMVVTIVIAMFIAGRFFIVGVLLAMWGVVAMAVFPVIRGIAHLAASPRLRRRRGRAFFGTFGAVLACLGFLFFVPMPFHSYAEGVLWLPEEDIVRAGASGFFDTFLVQPGSDVVKGDRLANSYDPALQAELRRSEGKVSELEAEYAAAFVSDQTKAQIVRDKIDSERANLTLIRQRAADLVARAGTNGKFVVPDATDKPGRYYKKGEPLGYVISKARALARVVVRQDAIGQVRLATDRVRVRLSERSPTVFEGRVVREVPAGDEALPSPALAAQGGGDIATDPRETKSPKALERVFQIDVELAGADARVDGYGQRVFVRFEHRMEPLWTQWYRRVRQLFLTSFNV